jgi:hypothetical protein
LPSPSIITFVVLHPVIHAAELDVADDVVDREQAEAGRRHPVLVHPDVAREVRARVVVPVHERVDVLAVRADGGQLDTPKVVLEPVRLDDADRAALDGVPVGVLGARHGQRHILDAVSVRAREARDLAVRPQPARDDEPDVVLFEHVRGAIADTGLRAGVRNPVEPERALVEVCGLLRVADPELDVIPALDRHEVLFAHDPHPIPGRGDAPPSAAERHERQDRQPPSGGALGSARTVG